ncbi:uncharacterized protein V1518DRAFT_309095 [Limtongia smithiae]|uniref:uncharacterized protein n=1 Tax=Limtongia smithiae TaxID=1125753 RepID=UPI0034CFCA59
MSDTSDQHQHPAVPRRPPSRPSHTPTPPLHPSVPRRPRPRTSDSGSSDVSATSAHVADADAADAYPQEAAAVPIVSSAQEQLTPPVADVAESAPISTPVLPRRPGSPSVDMHRPRDSYEQLQQNAEIMMDTSRTLAETEKDTPAFMTKGTSRDGDSTAEEGFNLPVSITGSYTGEEHVQSVLDRFDSPVLDDEGHMPVTESVSDDELSGITADEISASEPTILQPRPLSNLTSALHQPRIPRRPNHEHITSSESTHRHLHVVGAHSPKIPDRPSSRPSASSPAIPERPQSKQESHPEAHVDELIAPVYMPSVPHRPTSRPTRSHNDLHVHVSPEAVVIDSTNAASGMPEIHRVPTFKDEVEDRTASSTEETKSVEAADVGRVDEVTQEVMEDMREPESTPIVEPSPSTPMTSEIEVSSPLNRSATTDMDAIDELIDEYIREGEAPIEESPKKFEALKRTTNEAIGAEERTEEPAPAEVGSSGVEEACPAVAIEATPELRAEPSTPVEPTVVEAPVVEATAEEPQLAEKLQPVTAGEAPSSSSSSEPEKPVIPPHPRRPQRPATRPSHSYSAEHSEVPQAIFPPAGVGSGLPSSIAAAIAAKRAAKAAAEGTHPPGEVLETAPKSEAPSITKSKPPPPMRPNKLTGIRAAFAKNLESRLGKSGGMPLMMPRPGKPLVSAAAEVETGIKQDDGEEARPESSIPENVQAEKPKTLGDMRRGRAKGPRGRKLPTQTELPGGWGYSSVITIWQLELPEETATKEVATESAESESTTEQLAPQVAPEVVPDLTTEKAPEETTLQPPVETAAPTSAAERPADPEVPTTGTAKLARDSVPEPVIEEPVEIEPAPVAASEILSEGLPEGVEDITDQPDEPSTGEVTPADEILSPSSIEEPSGYLEPITSISADLDAALESVMIMEEEKGETDDDVTEIGGPTVGEQADDEESVDLTEPAAIS